MATEYFLVKPRKKEYYYLGKRLSEFTHIKSARYGHKEDYHNYECFHDFVMDIIDNNDYFMESMDDETWGNITGFLYNIYEFMDDKILLVHDCQEDFKQYDNYKEVGSIITYFENIRKENND